MSIQVKFQIYLVFYISLFFYALVINFSILSIVYGFLLARLVSTLGVDLGHHRLWSHKTFVPKRWFEYTLMFFALIVHNGSSVVFAGVHRLHHAYSDTNQDPYNVVWWKLCLYLYKVKEFPLRLVSDLLRDPMHRWCHKNYFKIHFAISVCCLLDPVFFGYTIGAIVFWSTVFAGIVNVLAHRKVGYRNYNTKDNSTNIRWLQIWSLHEGLHNNHHHKASAYDFAMKKYEWDPAAALLRIFRKFNIVKLNTV